MGSIKDRNGMDLGSKASILLHSAFFIVQLSHPYMTIHRIAITKKKKRERETVRSWVVKDTEKYLYIVGTLINC